MFSVVEPGRRTPPWKRAKRPASASSLTSRRTVCSVTPNCSARASTVAEPRSRTSSRSRAWRGFGVIAIGFGCGSSARLVASATSVMEVIRACASADRRLKRKEESGNERKRTSMSGAPISKGSGGDAAQAFDVCIVGGGINGVGIARDLAGRGAKVVLCEQDDFASHTSGSSTKLIHGGLRYLEYYEFSLVRKALAEREGLLRSAPHI